MTFISNKVYIFQKGGNDSQSTNSTDTVEPPEKVPRRTGGREYVPAWGSGPFAILITLLNQEEKPNYPGFMLKAELQLEAQPLCDKSFTRPDPGSHYTAWSSMSQLVKKDLVSRCSNPAKYAKCLQFVPLIWVHLELLTRF